MTARSIVRLSAVIAACLVSATLAAATDPPVATLPPPALPVANLAAPAAATAAGQPVAATAAMPATSVPASAASPATIVTSPNVVAAPIATAPAPATSTSAAPGASRPSATLVPPAVAPEDDWIRPEDIADRADQLVRRLEARVSSEAASTVVERVEGGMAKVDHELDEAFEQARTALDGSPSLITIQDARRELEGVSEPFAAWRTQVETEARRLSEILAELDVASQRWNRTLIRPETTQAGDAVVRRVESSIAKISDAKAEMTSWRVRLLALADRLVDRTNAVTGTVEKLEAATYSESASIFVPDHAPIWARGGGSQLSRELPLVPTRLGQFARATTDYIVADPRPFLLQLVVWLALMFAMRGLPEHSRRRIETAHVPAESLRLLERPYAIAALLVLAMSPTLHPTAPHRVTQILGVLALVPVARILMLTSRRSHTSLYVGLFVLLLFDRLSSALVSLPAVTQFLFFFQLAFAVAVGLICRNRLVAGGNDPRLVTAIDLALLGVLAAILAEAGGWTSLAALTGRGILVSATAALYVYAITMSLEALLAYALATPTLRSSHFIDRNQPLVQRWGSVTLRVFGVLYWMRICVNALGLGEVASEVVHTVLTAGVTVGALSISLGGVLAFLLTLVVAMIASRLVHEVLEDEVFPRTNLPRGIPNALLTLSSYTIWSLGFVLALAAAGVELSKLAILVGGLGVGIGLGLQDVVKNFAAGITLLLERRLHVGDAVQIPDKNVFGRILSIGMRASVVRNWNGTEAIMPNDDLVSGTVTNWTLSDQIHRIEVDVGVAYGNDPAHIIELLLEVARADGRFLDTPPPMALFTAFGESSLDFSLRAWSDEPYETGSARRSELAVAVHAALKREGIEIPFPQREVNVTNVAPNVADLLRGEAARSKDGR